MFGTLDSNSHDSDEFGFDGNDFFEKFEKLKNNNKILYARKDLSYKTLIDNKMNQYKYEVLENRKQIKRKQEFDKRERVLRNLKEQEENRKNNYYNNNNNDKEEINNETSGGVKTQKEKGKNISKFSKLSKKELIQKQELEKARAAEALQALRAAQKTLQKQTSLEEFEKTVKAELRRRELERQEKAKQFNLEEKLRKEDEKFLLMKKDKELLLRQQREDTKQAMLRKIEIKNKVGNMDNEVKRQMKKAEKQKIREEMKKKEKVSGL